ncbi:integrin alpha pat-2-like [Liolophura sinensis]|uniref:integrin alpha pat-2-like n=1 Tax=Liolophura sinensis TaxID=3198878 RepID=UPI00315910F2
MEGTRANDQHPGEGAVLRGCGHCPRGVCTLWGAGNMSQYPRASQCSNGAPNYSMSAKVNSQCFRRITSATNSKLYRKDCRLNSKRTSLQSDSPFFILFCQSIFLLRCLIYVLPYVILVTFPVPSRNVLIWIWIRRWYRVREAGSMFGYAVALHKSSQDETSLLVGAPKARTAQPGVTRGGAVYRCGTSRGIGCAQMDFDYEGNEKKYNGSYLVDIEEKSNQWFGATVVSHGDLIVACAPRYVYHAQTLDRKQLVGNCLASEDYGRTVKAEYSPCKRAVDNSNSLYIDQHDQHGKCELGFSASISLNGKRVLLGAPGTWFWQGQVFNFRTDPGARASVATPEGKAEDDYGFMGYDSAVGEFDGDDIDDYVVGVPRGEALLGKVTVYTQALNVIKEFPGKQYGAFFGTAVAASDFNNDGLDDIVAGAPQYSDYKSSKSFDKGEAYVFYQEEPKFESFREQVIESPVIRGRFGDAMAALGDINNDNFNDLAIAAPYGGKERRGVVYIYHGSQNGLKPKISQVIHGADVDSGLRSFGYSISGGLDMDGNFYPDVLIGAYESDRAVLLRSRPIVNVVSDQAMFPLLVNLELQNCILPSTGARLACVSFETCFAVCLSTTVEIDSIKQHSKRAFIEEKGKFLTSKKERLRDHPKYQKWCKTFTAFLRPDFRDLLTPIAMEFKYELIQRKDPRKERLIPILDMYSPNPIKTQAQILKNCGEDNICIPDLALFAETATKAHILDSEDATIEFSVTVENRGEDAFESLLYMTLPNRVFFNGMEPVKTPDSVIVSCSSVTTNKGGLDIDIIICDLGNPLPAFQKVDLKIKLSPKYVSGEDGNLNFTILVNSTNPENKTHLTDNIVTREIPITAVAKVDLTGSPSPEQATYNSTDTQKSTHLSHIYLFRNNGPSRVKTAQVQILWPSFHQHGLEVLPLVGLPSISRGDGKCRVITVDPKNNTDDRYLFKRRFKSDDPRFDNNDDDEEVKPLKLRCRSGWCTLITCTITKMPIDIRDSVKINVTARLSNRAIASIGHKGAVIVQSDGLAKVIALDYELDLDETKYDTDSYSVITDVNSLTFVSPPERVPIWIVGVAIAVGLLLLILLILLLWKLGFFKRNRPDSGVPENEPLNENGK